MALPPWLSTLCLRYAGVCFIVWARSGAAPGGGMPSGLRSGLPRPVAHWPSKGARRQPDPCRRPCRPQKSSLVGRSGATPRSLRRQDARYLHQQAARRGEGDRRTTVDEHRTTGAARRLARTARRHRVFMTAFPPLHPERIAAASGYPACHARVARAAAPGMTRGRPVSAPLLSSVLPGLRSCPLPPSLDSRPDRRATAPGAAHRSPGPNDETHADRRQPRGRNPRGGTGR